MARPMLKTIIKNVLRDHEEIVARQGITQPQEFVMTLNGTALNRQRVAMLSKLKEAVQLMLTDILAGFDDRLQGRHVPDRFTPEYVLLTKRLFALRAVWFVMNSSSASKSSSRFTSRLLNASDLADMISISGVACEKLDGSNALVQFRADPKPDEALLYTWMVVVDGVCVTRGTQQPMQKFLTSLGKPAKLDEQLGQHEVQVRVQEVVNLANSEQKYYYYLTNTHIPEQYQYFRQHRSVDSCMSKDHGYYEDISDDQHPMECYNDSPDWSMMLISDKSPAEIQANLDSTDTTVYPFLSRCMVLPRHLVEYYQGQVTAAFVFGKIYGLERVISYFFSSSSTVHAKNDNPLLTEMYYIAGGRIKRSNSLKGGCQSNQLLPYFDRANQAMEFEDTEGKWWKSTHSAHYENLQTKGTPPPVIWKGLYREGVAQTTHIYCHASEAYHSHNTRKPVWEETVCGPELVQYAREYYRQVDTNSGLIKVPANWTTSYAGNYYLCSTMMTTISGKQIPASKVQANEYRFCIDDTYGLFDLHSTLDAKRFHTLGLKIPVAVEEDEIIAAIAPAVAVAVAPEDAPLTPLDMEELDQLVANF